MSGLDFDRLPFGLAPDDLLLAMAGTGAALTVVALWSALVPRDPAAAKARALLERRMALKAAATAPRRRVRPTVQAAGLMRKVVERLNLLRSRQAEQVVAKLARAGLRSRDAIVVYLFCKTTLPMAALALAALPLFAMPAAGMQLGQRLMLLVLAALAGASLPDLYLRNRADRRRIALQRALPDGLDLMVICAEAGLSLDAALQRVGGELARPHPELADELGLTAVELSFLPERRRALDNLTQRTDLPGLRAMVNTLQQTERYGTPLAQALRVLAAELRNERMMKAEEKAARLPATLTVPMILFVLPPLFVVLIGPAILRAIDALRGM